MNSRSRTGVRKWREPGRGRTATVPLSDRAGLNRLSIFFTKSEQSRTNVAGYVFIYLFIMNFL